MVDDHLRRLPVEHRLDQLPRAVEVGDAVRARVRREATHAPRDQARGRLLRPAVDDVGNPLAVDGERYRAAERRVRELRPVVQRRPVRRETAGAGAPARSRERVGRHLGDVGPLGEEVAPRLRGVALQIDLELVEVRLASGIRVEPREHDPVRRSRPGHLERSVADRLPLQQRRVRDHRLRQRPERRVRQEHGQLREGAVEHDLERRGVHGLDALEPLRGAVDLRGVEPLDRLELEREFRFGRLPSDAVERGFEIRCGHRRAVVEVRGAERERPGESVLARRPRRRGRRSRRAGPRIDAGERIEQLLDREQSPASGRRGGVEAPEVADADPQRAAGYGRSGVLAVARAEDERDRESPGQQRPAAPMHAG